MGGLGEKGWPVEQLYPRQTHKSLSETRGFVPNLRKGYDIKKHYPTRKQCTVTAVTCPRWISRCLCSVRIEA